MSQDLSTLVKCPVYLPGDDGYGAEVAAFIANTVNTPALVVGVESAQDVVEAVRYASQNGLHVSIQTTGHGAHVPITGGLLISTKRLNQVSVDPVTKTATIGGGASWGAVVQAAAKYGLAPITGSSIGVGVVGYLLGGGLGPLARAYGFSSDYIESLTVVTGAGDIVTASADEHPDLFWALRGGKGGFGIVTEVRLRLVQLETLYGGAVFFAEENIEAALRAWVNWTVNSDPCATTSVAIFHFPPFDFIPEPMRGKRLLNLRFAYPESNERAMEIVKPLLDAAPVYLGGIGAMPATDIDKIHNDPTEPAASWVHGALLTHIDQEFATALLGMFGKGTNQPFIAVEIRQLGEATATDVAGGSAVGGRDAKFTLGLFATNPALFETVVPKAAKNILDTLQPWLSVETNINFVGDALPGRDASSAWSADVRMRLEQVRRKYDPDGILPHG